MARYVRRFLVQLGLGAVYIGIGMHNGLFRPREDFYMQLILDWVIMWVYMLMYIAHFYHRHHLVTPTGYRTTRFASTSSETIIDI